MLKQQLGCDTAIRDFIFRKVHQLRCWVFASGAYTAAAMIYLALALGSICLAQPLRWGAFGLQLWGHTCSHGTAGAWKLGCYTFGSVFLLALWTVPPSQGRQVETLIRSTQLVSTFKCLVPLNCTASVAYCVCSGCILKAQHMGTNMDLAFLGYCCADGRPLALASDLIVSCAAITQVRMVSTSISQGSVGMICCVSLKGKT